MKAVLCVEHGGPETLEIADIAEPVPGRGEAVVRVAAVGLNFFDTLIIANRYQEKPPLPFSPGAEMAGVVEAIGEGVSEVAPGDRVCGYAPHGTAREKVALAARGLTKLPAELDFDRAAGLTVTYGTALHALEDRARLRAGETLAVLGAAGGTGLAAIEIGKILGARVIACASSPQKLALAQKRGADEAIDYSQQDLKDGLRALTGGRGADVVFDPVGGPFAELAVRGTARDGRYLVVGFTAGIPKLALNHVLLRGCSVVGVAWGSLPRKEPASIRPAMERIVRWAVEGRVSAHIGAVYPLEQAVEALKDLAQRRAQGKILLKP